MFVAGIIPGPYINLPAQGIKISTGALLVVNGSANLVLVNTGLANSGQFLTGNGAVVFKWNSVISGSFINGSCTTGLNNLTLNKFANGLQLGSRGLCLALILNGIMMVPSALL